MQYLKFFFLMILDLFFSLATSYFIGVKWISNITKHSSGTGGLGDALFAWISTIVIFVILLGVFGFIFYWMLFTLI